jgi:hypothetical protein
MYIVTIHSHFNKIFLYLECFITFTLQDIFATAKYATQLKLIPIFPYLKTEL